MQVLEKDGKEHEGVCVRNLGESTTWAEHEATEVDPSFPIWKEGIFMDIVHSITWFFFSNLTLKNRKEEEEGEGLEGGDGGEEKETEN